MRHSLSRLFLLKVVLFIIITHCCLSVSCLQGDGLKTFEYLIGRGAVTCKQSYLDVPRSLS